MNSFLAFGKDYVSWNYEKTGNPVYLHIKQTTKSVPEDRPLKKPTLLAIGIYNDSNAVSILIFEPTEGRLILLNCFKISGVDGGFDNNEPEYEDSYSIVILPDFVSLPFPSVELPEKVFVTNILLSLGVLSEIVCGNTLHVFSFFYFVIAGEDCG